MLVQAWTTPASSAAAAHSPHRHHTCACTQRRNAATEFLHVKPGKGAAFVRTKLKNLLTNSNQEKTFRGGETVGMAEVSRREGQFTYADGDQVRARRVPQRVSRSVCARVRVRVRVCARARVCVCVSGGGSGVLAAARAGVPSATRAARQCTHQTAPLP
jgi:hypothetical protein